MLLAPLRAPSNVRVTNLQGTMVMVEWDHLPQRYARGLLLGYKVYYREKRQLFDPAINTMLETVNSSVSSVVLRDLKQGHQYEVQVAAFNSIGEGPRSVTNDTTTSEHNIDINWFSLLPYKLKCA